MVNIDEKYALFEKRLLFEMKKIVFWIEDYFVWLTLKLMKISGINKEELLDPNGSEYIIWLTSRGWWWYQILAFLEDKNGDWIGKSHEGYTPRSKIFLEEEKDYKLMEANKIKLNESLGNNSIRKWDIVSWNEVTWRFWRDES